MGGRYSYSVPVPVWREPKFLAWPKMEDQMPMATLPLFYAMLEVLLQTVREGSKVFVLARLCLFVLVTYPPRPSSSLFLMLERLIVKST